MDFVERRIEQGRRAGLFDDLELEGQPIPDLDDERPPGWWGAAYVARDRSLRRVHRLVAELHRRKGIAMLEDDHEVVRASLLALNAELEAANGLVETKDRADGLDIEAEMAAWRERRRQRLWGRYLED
jgi:hypothetical protein